MCLGSKKSTPPPPVEAAVPPPEPVKRADPEVKNARKNARANAAKRTAGRKDTILGGALQNEPGNQPRKTLLGQ